MIYISIFLTICWLVFLVLATKKANAKIRYSELKSFLNRALKDIKAPESIFIFISYVSFLLLPLFWGLTFLLKTDFNVIVVLFFIVWVYNWIKYIFLHGEQEHHQ